MDAPSDKDLIENRSVIVAIDGKKEGRVCNRKNN